MNNLVGNYNFPLPLVALHIHLVSIILYYLVVVELFSFFFFFLCCYPTI